MAGEKHFCKKLSVTEEGGREETTTVSTLTAADGEKYRLKEKNRRQHTLPVPKKFCYFGPRPQDIPYPSLLQRSCLKRT